MSDDGIKFGSVDELCSKCGAPVYRREHPALRMCPRHAREHLASLPPFACTTADIDAGYEPTEEQIQQAAREAEARSGSVTPIRREARDA